MHTSLNDFEQVSVEYAGQSVVTDNFHITAKIKSDEDEEGNCYDWYEIDRHYRTIDKYTPHAEQFEQSYQAATIAFVTMAEKGDIDDVTAGEHMDAFSPWSYPVSYKAGNLRTYGGKLYRCLQDHTSQEDWSPESAASLWTPIADPAEEWPQWSQPVGAHDAYTNGAKVSHNGKHWTSTVDANVWEPGVYGWTEAEGE